MRVQKHKVNRVAAATVLEETVRTGAGAVSLSQFVSCAEEPGSQCMCVRTVLCSDSSRLVDLQMKTL